MIICVCGPTCVGKTKLSIELAKKYDAEIINFDSVQIYKKMDIVSAKVTPEEMMGIKHHLIDIKNYNEDYSVFDYQKDSRKIIDKLLKDNKNIILVGGTGLYLKASLFDYRFNKEDKNNDYDSLSIEELVSRIEKINPDTKVDKSNKRRLIRELINLENNTENTLGNNLLYDNVYFIGLETDRETLYKRINDRVDRMINNGLIDEAKYFYNLDRTKAIMTPIGYKELFKYFDNEISLKESIDLIKQNSRHYAKRQFTFFKNQLNIKWFETDYTNFNNTINNVIEYMEEYNGKNNN